MKQLLLVAVLALAPVSVFADSQTVSTSGGILDVRVSYDSIEPGEPASMVIEFINPRTGKIQEHVDYTVQVSGGGENVFGPTPLVHSSEGIIRGLKVSFPGPGDYSMKLSVEGILFQPIAQEVASLAIPIKTAQAQPAEPEEGGGCIIATAVYGSELAPQVQYLREIRDERVLATDVGRNFMGAFNQVYYAFSPGIADLERENPVFRELVGIMIQPMLLSLHIMEHADSDIKVLAYGMTAILANAALYLGGPAFAALWSRRLIKRHPTR